MLKGEGGGKILLVNDSFVLCFFPDGQKSYCQRTFYQQSHFISQRFTWKVGRGNAQICYLVDVKCQIWTHASSSYFKAVLASLQLYSIAHKSMCHAGNVKHIVTLVIALFIMYTLWLKVNLLYSQKLHMVTLSRNVLDNLVYIDKMLIHTRNLPGSIWRKATYLSGDTVIVGHLGNMSIVIIYKLTDS